MNSLTSIYKNINLGKYTLLSNMNLVIPKYLKNIMEHNIEKH